MPEPLLFGLSLCVFNKLNVLIGDFFLKKPSIDVNYVLLLYQEDVLHTTITPKRSLLAFLEQIAGEWITETAASKLFMVIILVLNNIV